MFKVGIDIGSTTVKIVVLGEEKKLLFSRYKRHNARAKAVVAETLKELLIEKGDIEVSVCVTGSVGLGMSEQYAFPFVQEVVAATQAIQQDYPSVASMIDIGGEDAKIVFFKHGEPADLRMNGNCAGGTGAFIDQMAVILGTTVDQLTNWH